MTLVKMHEAGVTHHDINAKNIVVEEKMDSSFSDMMGTRYEFTFVDFRSATINDVSVRIASQGGGRGGGWVHLVVE